MARTLPRGRVNRAGRLGASLDVCHGRDTGAVPRCPRNAPETRVRPRDPRGGGRVQARPGTVDARHVDWSEMTAGAAGAGGSVVGGAAAVLMVAVALNGAPAWRTASVDPAQQRPLFLRPEVVRHARRP